MQDRPLCSNLTLRLQVYQIVPTLGLKSTNDSNYNDNDDNIFITIIVRMITRKYSKHSTRFELIGVL